jgi:hypothetical protein
MKKYLKDSYVKSVYEAYQNEKALLAQEKTQEEKEFLKLEQKYYQQQAEEEASQQEAYLRFQEQEALEREAMDLEQESIEQEMEELQRQQALWDEYVPDEDEEEGGLAVSEEEVKGEVWLAEYREEQILENLAHLKEYRRNEERKNKASCGHQGEPVLPELESSVSAAKSQRRYPDTFFNRREKKSQDKRAHKNARTSHVGLLKENKRMKASLFTRALCKPSEEGAANTKKGLALKI